MTATTPDSERTTSAGDGGASTDQEPSTDRDGTVPLLPPLVDRLRQPAYTGENRCLPCTAVNVGIAVVVGAGLSYGVGVVSDSSTYAASTGVVFLLVALATIGLRGYLVPYTPTLTKRYLPDRVLRWFEQHNQRSEAATEELSFEDVDVEGELRSLGAIEECPHQDDLCLTPSFERQWRDRMHRFREMDRDRRRDAIAELLELEADHTVEEYGTNAAIVTVDGMEVAQWESDAAFVADLAADELLRERTEHWSTFSIPIRGQLLNSLRMFLERCPLCESPVSLGQDTVESCCRSVDVVAVTCTACDARVFEVEVTPELQEQG